jgi:hypothetical protein
LPALDEIKMAGMFLTCEIQFLNNVSIVRHFPTNGCFKQLSPGRVTAVENIKPTIVTHATHLILWLRFHCTLSIQCAFCMETS